MSRHPLEEKWNTTAWDILSAIEHGFRAQVDVKGKLAEWFLFQTLDNDRAAGRIDRLVWQDKDGAPDFLISVGGRELRLECRNLRSPASNSPPGSAAKVELQKTRNSKTGEPTRGYGATEFEVLAACLFNSTGRWSFLFIATRRLAKRPAPLAKFLQIMQPVPLQPAGFWRYDLYDAIKDAIE